MALFDTHHPAVLAFGLLGNLISFIVFLAPLPTFVRICKKKSTEGFQSVPYVVALFSGMLWLYYASFKPDETLLITINSVGCVIETVYIAIFVVFAPKQIRVSTLRFVLLLNFGGFCVILLVTHLLVQGSDRVKALGWICVAFSVCVFAAPLSIMRLVIRTKSVEFMPFSLSFFLTLSAITWLLYGVFLKDFYVALPNVLGFIFGVAQMILYLIYKKQEIAMAKEMKLPEHTTEIIMITAAAAAAAEEKEDSSLPPSIGAIEVIITNGIQHDNKMELDLKDKVKDQVKDKDKNLEVNHQITVPIVV
ncbi:bidirectional sugar transporter SWEET12-like isoform X1 [Cucurbita moschata]|uniref:Bidirectional sugar transporter SWEET n=1 Tax=Cucurbita moschata TaxID=3662 RepID=A0A6J1E7H2_CUCMO|nr:bidirectional sugar transporter SWEET12-like isoform X1 [Cucurbita moschata]